MERSCDLHGFSVLSEMLQVKQLENQLHDGMKDQGEVQSQLSKAREEHRRLEAELGQVKSQLGAATSKAASLQVSIIKGGYLFIIVRCL